MEQQEALEWAKRQDIVKVRTIRENEKDKFVFAVGEYIATPHVFDTQEEAEEYLLKNFNLNNLELAIIGAMTCKLSQLYEATNKQ